jgi:hypothetical protein
MIPTDDGDDMVISDHESVASAGSPSIFSTNSAEDDSDSSVSEEDSDDSDSDESDSEEEEEEEEEEDGSTRIKGEVPYSPEYYLAAAENLDVSQLRQQRYSPLTRKKLEETHHLWKRYAQIPPGNEDVSSSSNVRFLMFCF